MNTQITITNNRHSYGGESPSMGGVGGFAYSPETTRVEWSDGTQLVVEDQQATAIYHGTSYRLQRIDSSLHSNIVKHWTERISERLQRDVPTSLTERVQSGWQSNRQIAS